MVFMNGLTCAAMALGATLFTWLVTALGAGLTFCFRAPERQLLDGLLGFAAGVMTAASFWSLLAPAIELAEVQGQSPWLIPALGFLLGGWMVDDVFEPLMAAVSPYGVAAQVFGCGKGSGAAAFFMVLGFAGTSVCVWYWVKLRKYHWSEAK